MRISQGKVAFWLVWDYGNELGSNVLRNMPNLVSVRLGPISHRIQKCDSGNVNLETETEWETA